MRRSARATLPLLFALAAFSHAGIVATHGALKTVGNQIVDASGAPIQIAGMSLFWTSSDWLPNENGGRFFNTGTVNTLAQSWKSSVIRVPMSVRLGSQTSVYKDANKAMLRTVIDAAIANDIYVIVDWHTESTDPDANLAKPFFKELATAYKSSPHLIWEIWNEPTAFSSGCDTKSSDGWSTIKSYATDIVKIIRDEAENTNLILVGSPCWSKRPDLAAADPVVGTNIAYTVHFYAGGGADHNALLRGRMETAMAKIPIFLTEWGTTNPDGGTKDRNLYLSESTTWLDWAKDKKVSWANWSVSSKDEKSAAFTTSASASGSWPEDQITESGKYVRTKIQEVTARISTNGGGGPGIKVDTLNLPGTIEADKTTALSTEGIKVETDKAVLNLGYTTAGSWAEYTVKVAQAGTYLLRAQVATAASGSLSFKLNDVALGTLQVDNTGGWETWAPKDIQVNLPSAGVNKFRIEWGGTGQVNLDWIQLSSGSGVRASHRPQNLVIRALSQGLWLQLPNGTRQVSITDVQGRHLVTRKAETKPMLLPVAAQGLVLVQIDTPEGSWSEPVLMAP